MIKKAAILGFSVVLMTSLFGSMAFADDKPQCKTVNQRQYCQKERIEDGINDGSLNKHEAARLAAQERAILKKERIYRSDGELTKRERLDRQTDLNHTNRYVYTQTHDKQSR